MHTRFATVAESSWVHNREQIVRRPPGPSPADDFTSLLGSLSFYDGDVLASTRDRRGRDSGRTQGIRPCPKQAQHAGAAVGTRKRKGGFSGRLPARSIGMDFDTELSSLLCSLTILSLTSDANLDGFREKSCRPVEAKYGHALADRRSHSPGAPRSSVHEEDTFAGCQHNEDSSGQVTWAAEAGDGLPERTHEASSGNGAETASNRSSSGRKRGTKRRGVDECDDACDDADDDDSHKNPEMKKTRFLSEDDCAKMFACPFYKHNPQKYRSRRTCPGPGWALVHRVKEHIFRRHRMPASQCPRCHEVFRSLAEFDRHLVQSDACAVRPAPKERDGISRDQELMLRKRGKSTASEEEKWYEVYRILFPDDQAAPTPYYDEASFDWKRVLEPMRREFLDTVPTRIEGVLAAQIDPTAARRILPSMTNVLAAALDEALENFVRTSREAPQAQHDSFVVPAPATLGSAQASSSQPESRPSQPTFGVDENPSLWHVGSHVQEVLFDGYLFDDLAESWNRESTYTSYTEFSVDSGFVSNNASTTNQSSETTPTNRHTESKRLSSNGPNAVDDPPPPVRVSGIDTDALSVATAP